MKSFCPEGSKVRFATKCMRERARDWWVVVGYDMGAPAIKAMTWPNSMTRFRVVFALAIEVQQLATKFQYLRQKTETVAKITTKFTNRALLVPQYATNKEKKKTQYHDMLMEDIRDFVSFSACHTLDDMIARAQKREIDLEHLGKEEDKADTDNWGSCEDTQDF